MKVREFLEELNKIKEENPEIFDNLKIEFIDEAGGERYCKQLNYINLDKYINTITIGIDSLEDFTIS